MLLKGCRKATLIFSIAVKGNHAQENITFPIPGDTATASKEIAVHPEWRIHMTVATPPEETKPALTPEQRKALGRVYSYLMDIARKRLIQQNTAANLQLPSGNTAADQKKSEDTTGDPQSPAPA
jgi:hypothetical protein